MALGLQKAAQPLDKIGRPLGEIGNRAVLDLAFVAVGYAKKDAGRGVAIADAFNKHGYLLPVHITRYTRVVTDIFAISKYVTWLR